MKSKEILPESQRWLYDIREDENLDTVAYTNGDVKILMEALSAAENEVQDKENEFHEETKGFATAIIKREDEIHKHISRVQDLEKEIKEYKKWAKNNVPELVRLLKERKV